MWQGCVWQYVCDKVVCDQVVCDNVVCVTICLWQRCMWQTCVCVTKLYVTRLYVTICMWQGCMWPSCVWQCCMCDNMYVTRLYVTKLCGKCRRRRPRRSTRGADLKTRTPHNFVGKKGFTDSLLCYFCCPCLAGGLGHGSFGIRKSQPFGHPKNSEPPSQLSAQDWKLHPLLPNKKSTPDQCTKQKSGGLWLLFLVLKPEKKVLDQCKSATGRVTSFNIEKNYFNFF